MHQNKAISDQCSKFLCQTDGYEIMHRSKAISEQSSRFLCNTDEL